jgi:hypothetical protein
MRLKLEIERHKDDLSELDKMKALNLQLEQELQQHKLDLQGEGGSRHGTDLPARVNGDRSELERAKILKVNSDQEVEKDIMQKGGLQEGIEEEHAYARVSAARLMRVSAEVQGAYSCV